MFVPLPIHSASVTKHLCYSIHGITQLTAQSIFIFLNFKLQNKTWFSRPAFLSLSYNMQNKFIMNNTSKQVKCRNDSFSYFWFKFNFFPTIFRIYFVSNQIKISFHYLKRKEKCHQLMLLLRACIENEPDSNSRWLVID